MIDITQTTQLHNTELHLPRYGLGAAHISNAGEAVAVKTVETALARGIRFIDTAPLYGAGRSERYIGRAVAGVPRDSYLLATKVGRLVQPNDTCLFDFSRDGILRSLEESLERLQLDSVDILHIHDPDDHYEAALAEAFPTLEELRSQGVIKAIGSGMNQWEMLSDFARQADFNCFLLAGRYTLLEQKSLDFLTLCQEKKMGVILGGVYNSGILASDLGPSATYNYSAAPEAVLEKARKIAEICKAHNVPLNVAALQFPYGHPAVRSMVIGAEAPEQVVANLAALRVPVPAALWTALQQAGLLHPNTPLPH